MLHERHFKAMNTGIGVWLWTDGAEAPAELDEATAFFEEVEQAVSRFRKDSDLCKLNQRAGSGAVAVSPPLREVIAAALEAARDTDGLFDPTVLPALEAAGYDVSFEQIRPDDGFGVSTATALSARPTWQQVMQRAGTVLLPAGVALDLGGVAKGWTVDRLAERLSRLGPVMVDAGGDIRAFGCLEDGPWPVGVGDPFAPDEDLVTLELEDEAIATSSVGKRRWQREGRWMHHIIDPATQKPAASDLHTVTVIAPTARTAEIHAKVALMLGSARALKHLEARGLSALMVRHDRSIALAGDRIGR